MEKDRLMNKEDIRKIDPTITDSDFWAYTQVDRWLRVKGSYVGYGGFTREPLEDQYLKAEKVRKAIEKYVKTKTKAGANPSPGDLRLM